MKRRSFIKATGIGLTGLSGCTGVMDAVSDGRQLPPYITIEFAVLDETADVEKPGFGEPPRIALDTDQQRVRVTGSVMVGSGNCNKASLESVTYDEDERRFRAVIGATSREPDGHGCEGDETSDYYRLTVEFGRNYPDNVVVEEDGRTTQVATAEN